MAGWRRAVELAMSDEEIAALTTLSRSRLELASRVSRAQMLLAYRENPSFCAVGQRLGVIIRRCSAVSSGRWPMARWQPSTIARDRARNQPSRLRPKPGWCRWRATRPRTTATGRGRRGGLGDCSGFGRSSSARLTIVGNFPQNISVRDPLLAAVGFSRFGVDGRGMQPSLPWNGPSRLRSTLLK